MTNKPSEEALLAEYEACQLEANASGSYVFQSGIIFFVTTLTLAGVAISHLINAEGGLYRCALIILLGVFSIVALFAWKKYANRQRFIRDVMYERMHMIEKELGLRKNWYVRFLDEVTKDTYKNEGLLPLEEAETLWRKYAKHPGRKPRGFKLVDKIAWIAIIAWVVLIILEVVIYLSPVVRQWLLDS